ncbi:hypothetical protein ZWY2020_040877 [Hordeum vulgare]|nr:hypothetical protein ZWY2020_040877 [Hordeum vulgare]
MQFLTLIFVVPTPLGCALTPSLTDKGLAKDRLQPLYLRKGVLPKHLDIMHRIFRNTLFPRSGNFDEVHGALAEMLLLCEEAMSVESAQLDIADVMFTELWNCIINRKAKGQYQSHVAEKQSRQRHKRVLRTLDVDISSGSEDDITPEATWMQAQGYQWSGDEAPEEEETDQEGTDESGDPEDEE